MAAGPTGCQGTLRHADTRSSAFEMDRKDEEKRARLAAALRENLRRRKAQARGAPHEPATPERPPQAAED